jgi:hypothetical protein
LTQTPNDVPTAFGVGPDGRVTTNMSVREIVERKMKRRERE